MGKSLFEFQHGEDSASLMKSFKSGKFFSKLIFHQCCRQIAYNYNLELISRRVLCTVYDTAIHKPITCIRSRQFLIKVLIVNIAIATQQWVKKTFLVCVEIFNNLMMVVSIFFVK